jgi:hypothetical protein
MRIFIFPLCYSVCLPTHSNISTMSSSNSSINKHAAAPTRRYRRSSFNGAKQLAALEAENRQVLWALGALGIALLVALVVVAIHMAGSAT